MRISKERVTQKRLVMLIAVVLVTAVVVALLFLLKPAELSPAEGKLDLAQRTGGKSLSLNGEWDFYWQRLVSYEDILSGVTRDIVADSATFWKGYTINGKKLSAFGYATYALNVQNATVGQNLALNIPAISTAYRLYIDGDLLADCGTVGTTAEEHRPQSKQQIAEFTVKQSNFYVIIHVSNFSSAYGGMSPAPTMGAPQQINGAKDTARGLDIFSLGALFTMVIYYLSYTLFGKGDKINRKPNLFLVGLCILYAIRILIYSGIIPISSFKAATAAGYLLLFWFSAFGIYIMDSVFPKLFIKQLKPVSIAYAAILSVVVLSTPVTFFTKFTLTFELIAVGVGLYLVAGVAIAFLRGRRYAAPLLLTGIIVVLCSVKDLFLASVPVLGYRGEMVPISILILLAAQPFLHARNATTAYDKIVETEAAFMQAQIKPHFIYNVLSAISAYCESAPQYAQKLIDDFSTYLRLSFDFKKIESTVPLSREISLVKAYAGIQTARYPDMLKVEYDICENVNIAVPLLSIQPLVENAILHGVLQNDNGGVVKVKVSATKSGVLVSVTDDGAGIPSEKLTGLTDQETEHGIGLYNINKRLIKQFGNGLSITSAVGAGTTVSYLAKRTKKFL